MSRVSRVSVYKHLLPAYRIIVLTHNVHFKHAPLNVHNWNFTSGKKQAEGPIPRDAVPLEVSCTLSYLSPMERDSFYFSLEIVR
jgi:hypothetical protein